MKYKIYNSEFVAWANSYEGKKFHAVLCDPPYGLAFMGQQWDSHQNFDKVVKKWGKALRKLLYPGALVFMFGGTRTWHRLAVGMEDAGFELWDTIMWLHGQGFPKAQNISKLIDSKNGNERKVVGKKVRGDMTAALENKIGYLADPANRNNTKCFGYGIEEITIASKQSAPWSGHKTAALKPAWEPILCFRAPSDDKTYADLALEFGSGALNIDAGRIGLNGERQPTGSAKRVFKANQFTDDRIYGENTTTSPLGRYPANLCLDKKSARMLDEITGSVGNNWKTNYGEKYAEKRKQYKGGVFAGGGYLGNSTYSDSGGASRFFYTAKAPKYERNEGLEFFTPHQCGIGALRDSGRGKVATNVHPTVKPISLNKWLAAMLLPAESVKRRRLLVPFSGSGSEMIGALRAGWDKVIGVEMNKDYCRIAKSRLKYWKKYKPVWKNLI